MYRRKVANDPEILVRGDELYMAVVTDDPACMFSAAPLAAARALAALILGTVAGLGAVALWVAWVVGR